MSRGFDEQKVNAYYELKDFVNWLASKHPVIWKKIIEEYEGELK